MLDTLAPHRGPVRRPVALGEAKPAPLPNAMPPVAAAAGVGLHEVYAAAGADSAAATGFVLAFTRLRLKEREQPLIWVRQDALQAEAGQIYMPGLAGFGIAPRLVICVRARDGLGVLQAALEAARCPRLSAVIADLWGPVKAYDLTASRRLSFAAKASGMPLYLLRHGAEAVASAAETRWRVQAMRSRVLPANAPGRPAFEVSLLRQRGGRDGLVWCVEWNNEQARFEDVAASPSRSPALSGPVVSLPAGGEDGMRRAG